MYGYICAILLLICGKVYSDSYADAATQIGGNGCLYDDKIVGIGVHTVHTRPCMQMVCDSNGQLTFTSCSRIKIWCNKGLEAVGQRPDTDGKPFPFCCPQPICRPKSNEPYALPLMSWE